MSTLLLHQGGWSASRADLTSVPVPTATDSYHPVPYDRFLEEIELHLPRFGLAVTRCEFALAREGAQMFGVLTCQNGRPAADYTLAVGLRNSYDRSLSVGLVAGTRVFCCDNLAFSGEVRMQRKHTLHVFRDLPDLIYRMLSQVASMKGRMDEEIAGMKARSLSGLEADHLILSALRRRIVVASQLPQVLAGWERPAHAEFAPRTAWSLYNAFSGVLRSRSPRLQMEQTLRLSALFREGLHR